MARRKRNTRTNYAADFVPVEEAMDFPEYEPYQELEEVQEIISGYVDFKPVDAPMKVVLDDAKVDAYAFRLIADEIGISDVPIDYQEAVNERRLKILRGE